MLKNILHGQQQKAVYSQCPAFATNTNNGSLSKHPRFSRHDQIWNCYNKRMTTSLLWPQHSWYPQNNKSPRHNFICAWSHIEQAAYAYNKVDR